jgi:hypothetical protein
MLTFYIPPFGISDHNSDPIQLIVHQHVHMLSTVVFRQCDVADVGVGRLAKCTVGLREG